MLSAPFEDVFLAAADRVAAERGVDPEIARELMAGAATMLHDGLVLDDLDDHDRAVAVSALADDLTSSDPAAAVKARADAVLVDPGDLHEPEVVAAAYLTAAATLRL